MYRSESIHYIPSMVYFCGLDYVSMLFLHLEVNFYCSLVNDLTNYTNYCYVENTDLVLYFQFEPQSSCFLDF